MAFNSQITGQCRISVHPLFCLYFILIFADCNIVTPVGSAHILIRQGRVNVVFVMIFGEPESTPMASLKNSGSGRSSSFDRLIGRLSRLVPNFPTRSTEFPFLVKVHADFNSPTRISLEGFRHLVFRHDLATVPVVGLYAYELMASDSDPLNFGTFWSMIGLIFFLGGG